MKKTYTIGTREAAAFAAIVFIAVFGTSAAFFTASPSEVHEIRMHLGVNNYTGFNLDTDALYFGTISPGGSGIRDLVLVNDDDMDKSVRVSLYGDLAGWVTPAETDFEIEKKSRRILSFVVKVPEGTEFGEYEGRIRLALLPVQ